MKTDAELIISGIKAEMTRLNIKFNGVLNQSRDYTDLIEDDKSWTELKELKNEYDELQEKLMYLAPPTPEEIPF